jgi:antitoxin component YwqK of YwqJK toxin-antitoxin module
MPAGKPKAEKHVQYHKNGTVWARGQTIDGVPNGYWQWFRVDGTLMRSGTFEDGEQVGEWTTYDKDGKVYKVTMMKRKPRGEKAKGAKRRRRS